MLVLSAKVDWLIIGAKSCMPLKKTAMLNVLAHQKSLCDKKAF
jgi:hypothetical protein